MPGARSYDVAYIQPSIQARYSGILSRTLLHYNLLNGVHIVGCSIKLGTKVWYDGATGRKCFSFFALFSPFLVIWPGSKILRDRFIADEFGDG